MAIFKPLHCGESIKALKGVVRYNSLEKKGFNSDTNPRLIGVHSNIGHCENVNDKIEYNQLMNDFVLEVESNSLLKKNSRQKYLYEHSVISFSEDDDKNLSIEKLTELALKIADEANPDGAPFMLWPQNDTDKNKLHFHLVRGLHDENGNYQKKKHDFHKMNNFVQKLELAENLTLTGKNNPDNHIYKTLPDGTKTKIYFPGNSQGKTKTKIPKNKEIDRNIKIEKKGNSKKVSKLKKTETTGKDNIKFLLNKKSKVEKDGNKEIKKINIENEELKKPIQYNLFNRWIVNNLTTQAEIDRQDRDFIIGVNNKQKKTIKGNVIKSFKSIDKDGIRIKKGLKKISSKIEKTNKEIKTDLEVISIEKNKDEQFNLFRKTINDNYRKKENAQDFLKALNESNIEASISYRANGSGGLSFNSLNSDISLAGGKVNSYLTFGKIKKNDPELFALLTGATGFAGITLTNRNDVNNNLNIETINKNYKQKINDDGSTSIFYSKKDSEKYPHNHNLKINADKNKISFGQFRNDHDIKLAYDLAKNENWTNAKSNDKELIQKSMIIAFSENKEDLFFFQTKEPTLKFEELKNIIGDNLLSKDNLIKLYDNNLVVESDKKEVLVFIKNQLKEHKEDITTINTMLADNHSLKECIEKNEKIEKQKEEQKTINEQKLKVIDKRSNLKNDQISEPKLKRAKSSRNRI